MNGVQRQIAGVVGEIAEVILMALGLISLPVTGVEPVGLDQHALGLVGKCGDQFGGRLHELPGMARSFESSLNAWSDKSTNGRSRVNQGNKHGMTLASWR